MRKILPIFLLLFSFFLIQESWGQADTAKIVVVTKQDGGKYTGVLLSDDGREVLIDSKEVGKIYIPKHLIKTIKTLEEAQQDDLLTDKKEEIEIKEEEIEEDPFDDGEFGYDNFTSTKYIQSDNAMPLRPGEAFLKFMPIGLEVQVPLKTNWSIGALSTYVGAPLVVKSKISFPVFKSSYFSLDAAYGSMMFGGLFDSGITEGGGYFNAGFTFGDRSNNFTAKIGAGLIHEDRSFWEWDELTGEIFIVEEGMQYVPLGIASFSGMTSINKRTQFVFDVIAAFGGFNGNYMTGAAAIRFGPKPRHRFQTGLAIMVQDDFFVPLPIPTLSYTFVFPSLK
ncbi:MAG: hypothetical protein BM555_03235 [Crocinitomix sp. MedPE-SWsnd]|nr:MAG: hypothetical protein BM555_03235 [Crocinitomix sp. MedPE-SWsnd]